MLTAARLRAYLKGAPDDMLVIDNQGRDLVHITNTTNRIVLSHDKPVGTCKRCGSSVFKDDLPAYTAYCPEHDESLLDFEVSPPTTEPFEHISTLPDTAYVPAEDNKDERT